MPSRKYHNRLSGKEYDYVHAAKDAASKILGKSHRRVGHDHLTNLALVMKKGDPNAFLEGEKHDYVDKALTQIKRNLREQGFSEDVIKLVTRNFE